jgi:uncharacterized membrane protein
MGLKYDVLALLLSLRETNTFTMPAFSENALLELLLRFALTLGFNLVLMRIVSKHGPESRKNVYSFFIISVVVFFLSHTLRSFDMQIGMAIGMFAVFGIVRYRTEPLRPQEMTYLFAAIGIALINALSAQPEGWMEMVVINALVLAFIYLLEKFLLREEVKPNQRKLNVSVPVAELEKSTMDAKVKDLESQMGIQVIRVQVSKVDYALGTAQIQLYYEE